jgi:hypothetical protein
MLLGGWLTGCAVQPTDASVPYGEATIYVVGRDWQTDIGLPMEETVGPLASLRGDFPGVRYMVFGFGERHYYMAHDAGSGEVLAALFPSKSAILVTALRVAPTDAFANHTVVTQHLPGSGADRIAARLWDDLEESAYGSATRLADGPYVGSAFYASPEIYDAFHTCNTWTALVLRQGGLPMNTHVLFADQVIQQVARIAAMQTRPAS